MKPSLRLRLIVLDPPKGVRFAMQRGRSELLAPTHSADSFVFDFQVDVLDLKTQPPRLTGEFTQGTPTARFVYVNSGTSAGELGSPWSRRAKVPLYGISADVIESALSKDAPLQATIAGTGKDGGPACASVKLLSSWALDPRS